MIVRMFNNIWLSVKKWKNGKDMGRRKFSVSCAAIVLMCCCCSYVLQLFLCAAVVLLCCSFLQWGSSTRHWKLPGHDSISQRLVASGCLPWRCDLCSYFWRRTYKRFSILLHLCWLYQTIQFLCRYQRLIIKNVTFLFSTVYGPYKPCSYTER